MGGSAKYRYTKKVAKINADPNLEDWERDMLLQDADVVYQEQRQRELERKAKRDGTYVEPEKQYDVFMKMSDEEKGKFISESVNKGMNRLPERLQVGGESRTQQLVYDLGLNDKPTVMSKVEFNKYMQDNNLTTDDLLTRSFDDANAMKDWMNADENYISGRFGGSDMGAGQYFAKTGGENSGYGNHSVNALLNPEKVKAVNFYALLNKFNSLSPEEKKPYINPKYADLFGDGMASPDVSVYALSLGYNVITYGDYYNIIDRSAVIICDEFF